MRLVFRILGTDVFEISTEPDQPEPGDDVPPATNVVGTGGSASLDQGGRIALGFTGGDDRYTTDE